MRVVDIIAGTTVDGPGLRTSIYFAGCAHHCPGCQNPHTHSPSAGKDMTLDELLTVIDEQQFDVTFTGGDPFFQAEEILPLAIAVKERGYNLWCYTGFTYEQAMASTVISRLMQYIDVLVDGPYIDEQRDVTLPFRGSANQRLIDVGKSSTERIVEYTP